jgi:hypothetical protein
MDPSSRDRLSVDLRGLKAALFDRAAALGVTPSGLVRTVLADALGQDQASAVERCLPRLSPRHGTRVRLCLRMSRAQASATLDGARQAGLNPGDYVGNLVKGVPVLSAGGSRTEHMAALTSSCAELSTLSRSIHHLVTLLRQGNLAAARPYRELLDTLAGDVRTHLELATRVLADLRPRAGGTHRPPQDHRPPEQRPTTGEPR